MKSVFFLHGLCRLFHTKVFHIFLISIAFQCSTTYIGKELHLFWCAIKNSHMAIMEQRYFLEFFDRAPEKFTFRLVQILLCNFLKLHLFWRAIKQLYLFWCAIKKLWNFWLGVSKKQEKTHLLSLPF